MRHEVVAAAQLASHAGLHVSIVGFRQEWHGQDELAGSVNFQQSRLWSQFSDQGIAIVQSLGGPDLFVFRTEFPFEDNLFFASHFLNDVAPCDQHVAVWQNEAVSRASTIFPDHFFVFIDNRGAISEDDI